MNKREAGDTVRAVMWEEGAVRLLDQRRLPGAEDYLRLRSAAAVGDAIRNMAVRGAPAIGIAAAYGVVLAARECHERQGRDWREAMDPVLQTLGAARPTAVNLRWALERMRARFADAVDAPETMLLEEARLIHEQDIAGNRRMGDLGAGQITGAVLTYCNAGSLATGGYGTALGVVRSAWRDGRLDQVFACETRPWMQGARLTVWELQQDGIPATLITDAAAASLMQAGRVRNVVTGADRIAANGDTANKIGTYGLAVIARHHGIPFMVAAPTSTIDLAAAGAADIPIEHRDAEEITRVGGVETAPAGTCAENPVFDVTPAALVDLLVTEKGLIRGPDRDKISALFASG
jgi:methylthioribose-1-phosphate isomerase